MIRIDFADGGSVAGDDASEVLANWNAEPWWADYDSTEFREALVRLTGADVEPFAADEEILDAVVEADPNATKTVAGATIGQVAKRLLRRR